MAAAIHGCDSSRAVSNSNRYNDILHAFKNARKPIISYMPIDVKVLLMLKQTWFMYLAIFNHLNL